MLVSVIVLILGLILLVWGADRFVDGAASFASHLGMSPLLIGMVVVGFGTSMPELVVSVFSAVEGNAGLALGNVIGSNIANISLILGVSAIMRPIMVHSHVLKKELPILCGVTLVAVLLIMDGTFSGADAWVLILLFAGLMGWTLWQGMKEKNDTLGTAVDQDMSTRRMPMNRSILWLVIGLGCLLASSRALVWAATDIARSLGIDDLVIGLTVVAVGTSLPELASSFVAARKGEDDIAIGNVLGSNLFNILAVLGISGAISPMAVPDGVLGRDCVIMSLLTLSLFVLGYGFGRQGRINRFEGCALLAVFVGYTAWLIMMP
ncbi:calcium/sodium antiporter [Desulfovibrio subterraneus]|uniref:Sodium:calcium antiporter n=1 Tax=Desulfovibrio subterraneus TaxID=2718620 RepID=A0A7J0BJT7_9BACT|nr:calcium/sodium antiporter [Desulfovibrio subterraneus]GFM33481.1 sodium:calcium antiporter [Desulfovibrio subterraneus]